MARAQACPGLEQPPNSQSVNRPAVPDAACPVCHSARRPSPSIHQTSASPYRCSPLPFNICLSAYFRTRTCPALRNAVTMNPEWYALLPPTPRPLVSFCADRLPESLRPAIVLPPQQESYETGLATMNTFIDVGQIRLPLQAAPYRRLRCWKVLLAPAIRRRHLHRVLYFHNRCRLCVL